MGPGTLDNLFFAKTPLGTTYFPFGRFSHGVIVPFGRDDEFRSFQKRWSLYTRVAAMIGALTVWNAPGSWKLAGAVVLLAVFLAKLVFVRRLTGALPRSDATAPGATAMRRAANVPLAPIFGLLALCIVLIAINAPGIVTDLSAGQASLHDVKVAGGPLLVAAALAVLLLFRRSG